MEHIFQVSINVSDSDIEKSIINSAAKEVEKAFVKSNGYYSDRGWARILLERTIENMIINEWKDEIIECAADKLFEYMKRKRVVTNAVDTVIKEIDND